MMGYDNFRKFNGIFGQVTIKIPDDYSQEESRITMRGLDELAKGMRNNKSIPIYWSRSYKGYHVLIPDLNDHGKNVLKDLGYDLKIVKLSRQQRSCAPWKKLKKQKYGGKNARNS